MRLKLWYAIYDIVQEHPQKSVYVKFVSQAMALLSDVEDYHAHKYGSSYERLSMMSFKNNNKIKSMVITSMYVLFEKLKDNVVYVLIYMNV